MRLLKLFKNREDLSAEKLEALNTALDKIRNLVLENPVPEGVTGKNWWTFYSTFRAVSEFKSVELTIDEIFIIHEVVEEFSAKYLARSYFPDHVHELTEDLWEAFTGLTADYINRRTQWSR